MAETWESLLAAHHAISDANRVLVPEHVPVAAILTCSDARVPPSLIFGQPAGRLYVVRVAGNTASPSAIASLDYAVSELGIKLIIVLGHTSCGAVGAACRGECGGYLELLIKQICDIASAQDDPDADRVAALNVDATVLVLTMADSPTGQAIRTGQVAVQGAIYDLTADQVKPLTGE